MGSWLQKSMHRVVQNLWQRSPIEVILVIGLVLNLIQIAGNLLIYTFSPNQAYLDNTIGLVVATVLVLFMLWRMHRGSERERFIITTGVVLSTLIVQFANVFTGDSFAITSALLTGVPIFIVLFFTSHYRYLWGIAVFVLNWIVTLIVLQGTGKLPPVNEIAGVIGVQFIILVLIALLIRDVTLRTEEVSRVQMQMLLAQKEKDLLEDRFKLIASLNHDIKGPLATMQALIEILRNNIREQDREALDLLEGCVDDILATTQQKLAVSIHQAGKKGVCNPLFVIQRIMTRYLHTAKKMGIDITVHIPDESILVALPDPILERALDNMMSNSLNIPGVTRIKLYIELIDTYCDLIVQDDGPGYPSIILQQGPQIGLSLRDGGIGVGLAGMLEVLRAYQATFILENKNGAKTTIRIPRHQEIEDGADRPQC